MKKHRILTLLPSTLSIFLLLSGCGSTFSADTMDNYTSQTADESAFFKATVHSTDQTADESISSVQNDNNETTEQTTICSLPLKPESTTVVQGGPYGKLTLCLPDGWSYETCPMDNEKLLNGLYGIRFYPEGVTDGAIELAYIDFFGVCGTGLSEEPVTVAKTPAHIGTYDNHAYWDFIAFEEDYAGIVALTYNVESWWEEYSEQVMNILDTLSYDASDKEGAAYIRSPEAELDKIGLYLTLEKITPAGATLVFHQYDEKAPTGELEYGDAFVLEVLKNNQWEKVPVSVNGDYGFHQVAYSIPKRDSIKQELNWEWLYGTLEAGSYRIQKEVLDFRASGDFDKYSISAQFLLN